MSMEIATRFITLRESGEDTAALALLTENATLGTVWGCINGKEAIANYFKDEKRFNYLKKQYGPLKQVCFTFFSIWVAFDGSSFFFFFRKRTTL